MNEYLDNLVDYKIITIYPTIAFVLFLYCKKYYKYIRTSLMFIDMYDNTYDYSQMKSNNDKYEDTEYINNMLLAFTHIPT